MTPAQYREAQAGIAAETEQKVAALYAVYASPSRPLQPQEFAGLLGVILGNANTRAAVLADVFQNSRLQKKPQGITRPAEEPAALADAVAGVLADDDEPLPRLLRIACTEPVQASRQAGRQVLAHRRVKSYVWRLSSKNPCGLCKFLAKRKWPVSKVPVSHPGCTCQILAA